MPFAVMQPGGASAGGNPYSTALTADTPRTPAPVADMTDPHVPTHAASLPALPATDQSEEASRPDTDAHDHAGSGSTWLNKASRALKSSYVSSKTALADLTEKQRTKAKEYIARKKDMLRTRARRTVDKSIDKAVDRTLNILKRKMKDPDMPGFVKRFIDGAVDEVSPDIHEEVRISVYGIISKDGEEYPPDKRRTCWQFVRGGLLYTLMPYDRSIWRQLKDPMYILLTLVSLLPFVGVQQAFFLLLFLLLEKSDEFQLVNFILSFKGLQFITLGLIGVVVGAAQYFACTNHENGQSTCAQDGQGPGNNQFIYVEAALFTTQIFVVWFAFFLLPYSRKMGGPRFIFLGKEDSAEIEKQEIPFAVGCCGRPKYAHRGGKLAPWLIYDLCVFLVCCALILYMMFSGTNSFVNYNSVQWRNSEWVFKMQLYWVKVLYGLLSFPFLLFKIPVVSTLFTHARPTAYTRAGECVRVLPAAQRVENREAELREKEAARADLLFKDGDLGDDDSDDDSEQGQEAAGGHAASASAPSIASPSSHGGGDSGNGFAAVYTSHPEPAPATAVVLTRSLSSVPSSPTAAAATATAAVGSHIDQSIAVDPGNPYAGLTKE